MYHGEMSRSKENKGKLRENGYMNEDMGGRMSEYKIENR